MADYIYFVQVHCDDEIDRAKFIPMSEIREINTNADGSDYIVTKSGETYLPYEDADNFFLSVMSIGTVISKNGHPEIIFAYSGKSLGM